MLKEWLDSLGIILAAAAMLTLAQACGKDPEPVQAKEETPKVVAVKRVDTKVTKLQNEPDNFRKLKFGASIDELKKDYKLVFLKDGYGMLFQDKETHATTVAVASRGGGMSGSAVTDPEEDRCFDCLSQKGKFAKIYKLTGDKMQIGEIPVEAIYYHFYEERFCGVEVRFDGKDWYDMEQVLFDTYGKQDDRIDEKIGWHKWTGNNLTIKLWKVPKYKTVEKCFIEYCYLPIKEEDEQRYQEEMKQSFDELRRKQQEEQTSKKDMRKKAKTDL